jgi:type VI secretion system protein ImpG
LGFKESFPSWFSLNKVNLETNITPIVNSFEKIAEPIVLENLKSEYFISPELGDKNKYEVINVNKVTLSSPGIDGAVEIPHVMDSETSLDGGDLSWSTRFEKSFGNQNIVKLKIHGFDPEKIDLSSQIALLEVTCHNKALAAKITPSIQLFANFELPAKCKITRFPTNYIPRLMDSEILWKLASRMDLSASMFIKGASSSVNASIFKDFIKTHIPISNDSIVLEVDSITDVTLKPVVKEIGKDGKFAIVEGLEAAVIVDEDYFMESSLYLFCDILNEMLSSLVSINSFVLLCVSTIQAPEEWEQWEPSHHGKPII